MPLDSPFHPWSFLRECISTTNGPYGEILGNHYDMSGKGWTDRELFSHWLKKHFLRYAVPGRLLLLDSHSSHYIWTSQHWVSAGGCCDLFCLPPHTTQESQLLNCTAFGPLKWHWSNAYHNFQQHNLGRVVTKFTFSRVFAQPWQRLSHQRT